MNATCYSTPFSSKGGHKFKRGPRMQQHHPPCAKPDSAWNKNILQAERQLKMPSLPYKKSGEKSGPQKKRRSTGEEDGSEEEEEEMDSSGEGGGEQDHHNAANEEDSDSDLGDELDEAVRELRKKRREALRSGLEKRLVLLKCLLF